MAEASLKIEHLDVGIAGRLLLRGVNITLSARQRVALVGPSGCGKSTLLRCIAGLIEPWSGSVRYADRSADQAGHPPFRREVLLVNQRPPMLDATVEQNLQRPFQYQSARQACFSRQRVIELFEQLGLDEKLLNQNARTLSDGERQRVGLIRALLIEPKVLLLDEPTSALDEQSCRQVEQLIEQAAGAGLAALMVLHNRQQASRWCEALIDLTPAMTASPPGAL